MIKITGLDKLQRDLAQAQQALSEADGELGTLTYDARDPASIEAAIEQAERLVDERLGAYASNPIIAPFIAGLKEHFRAATIDRAAAARLQG